MDYRRKLFLHRAPYALEETGALFLEAVRQNATFHIAHCPAYARACLKARAAPSPPPPTAAWSCPNCWEAAG